MAMVEDYPSSVLEQQFSRDEECHKYLCVLRWPDRFRCPRCAGSDTWDASHGRLVCHSGRHQTAVTTGTIFQDIPKPLLTWFRGISHVVSQKNGASAVNIQRTSRLGSYLTAWTWLNKLPRAMVRLGRDQLQDRVEMDETSVDSKEHSVDGRKVETKPLVVVAAEENWTGIGRTRLGHVLNAKRTSLHGLIHSAIAPPATVVHLDGLPAFRRLETLGYSHEATILISQSVKDTATGLLPRVHRVASFLKRWLLGTHQGVVSPRHLNYYLDQFTFRFYQRKSLSRRKLFYRLLQ